VVLSNENGDDVRGWQRLFPGDLEIERVDADHLGMLKPPWVERVAEAVRSRTYGDVRQP
jgi:thioesterase domain-containing protein